MTTYIDTTVKCPHCEHKYNTHVFGSYHSFGFNDLDGKTNDYSAPQYYVASFAHFCPKCGICFFEGEEVMNDDMKKYMDSEEYKTCKGYNLKGKAAEVFRYGLRRLKEVHDIEVSETPKTAEDVRLNNKKKGATIAAFKDVTWMGSTEWAKPLRKEIVQLMSDDYIESLPDCDRTSVYRIRADIMRQAGMFDEVTRLYDDVHFDTEYEEKCLRFIIEKAKQADPSPYSTEAVFWKQDPKDYCGTYWAYYHDDDDAHSSLLKIDEEGKRFDYNHLEDKWDDWHRNDDLTETIRYLKASNKQEVAKEDVERVKKSVHKYWYNWFHRIGHYWEHWGEEPIIIQDMPNTYWASHVEGSEKEYAHLIRFDENCSAEYYDAITEKWCDLATINNADDLEAAIMGQKDNGTGRDFYYHYKIDEKDLNKVMKSIRRSKTVPISLMREKTSFWRIRQNLRLKLEYEKQRIAEVIRVRRLLKEIEKEIEEEREQE